jgi:adenylate cyclase
MSIQESKLVLFATDLAGFSRACAHRDALAIARFLEPWYRASVQTIRARGGRVVKLIGDAVFAVFPEDRAVDAVDAAVEVIAELRERPTEGWRIEAGANIHLAVVAEGEYGPDDDRRYDVLGSGVNHLFSMGGGAGIRISEPIYRQLPNERREAWLKHRPPATYALRC